MKQKILLVNPIYKTKDILYFPLGLGYVAGACDQEGIEVKCIDMNISPVGEKQIIEMILRDGFHVVGIGGFLTALKSTLALVNLIKDNCKDTVVVVGGIQAYGCEQFIIDNSKVDIVCVGESELVLPQLVRSLYQDKDFSHIPSIVYRRNGEVVRKESYSLVVNLDEIPFPKYDAFNMETYIKRNYHSNFGKRTMDFICSRGCPYKCNYCINSKKPVKVRYRSPDNIISEIRLLKNRYAVNDFSFGDEIFTIDRKRSLEICDALKSENVTWLTSVRADGIDDELLSAMKSAGCRKLLIGFESGSEKILKSMNKRTTLGAYSRAITLLHKNDFQFYSNFMIGMPDEDEATIKDTEKFCIDNDLIFSTSYVTPFPGTKLYDDMKCKIGDESDYFERIADMNFSKKPVVNLTSMSLRKLQYLRNRTTVNTTAHILRKTYSYVPLSVIKAFCWLYIMMFNIKNPVVAMILRPINKMLMDKMQRS